MPPVRWAKSATTSSDTGAPKRSSTYDSDRGRPEPAEVDPPRRSCSGHGRKGGSELGSDFAVANGQHDEQRHVREPGHEQLQDVVRPGSGPLGVVDDEGERGGAGHLDQCRDCCLVHLGPRRGRIDAVASRTGAERILQGSTFRAESRRHLQPRPHGRRDIAVDATPPHRSHRRPPTRAECDLHQSGLAHAGRARDDDDGSARPQSGHHGADCSKVSFAAEQLDRVRRLGRRWRGIAVTRLSRRHRRLR